MWEEEHGRLGGARVLEGSGAGSVASGHGRQQRRRDEEEAEEGEGMEIGDDTWGLNVSGWIERGLHQEHFGLYGNMDACIWI